MNDYTCQRCNQPMRFNVPRLGPDGGFVHAFTGELDCSAGDMVDKFISAAEKGWKECERTGLWPTSLLNHKNALQTPPRRKKRYV